ncbi:MAG: glycosyltransferase [Lachnospiraceae bacterium]|nr:glycosyltransferase [Lachnospiraceae bacterium]
MEKILSIVIPVYNVKAYLRECLHSVAESVGEHSGSVEVIIIDDGSTDGSGIIADSFARCYPWFRVIHQANGGVAHARNAGLEQAKGEWLYLVDSDDWLEKGAVSSLLTMIAGNRGCDILIFEAYKNSEEKEEAWEHFPEEQVWDRKDDQKRPFFHELHRKVLYSRKTPLAAPWDKVYRLAFLRDRGIRFQKNLKVLDDMIFNLEAIGAAERISYLKKKIYHYRQVPDSITNSYRPDRVEQDRHVWKYIEEYMQRVSRKEEWTKAEQEAFRQSYYCRVVKSFSICCRLCFFHKKDERPLRKKLSGVKAVMRQQPYQEAFRRVQAKNLEWRLRLVVLMARLHTAAGIYLLHRGNQWWEKRKK